MVKKGEYNLALTKDFPLSVIDRYKSGESACFIAKDYNEGVKYK